MTCRLLLRTGLCLLGLTMKRMVTFPKIMTLQSALLGTIKLLPHWASGLPLHALCAVRLMELVNWLTRPSATPPNVVSVWCELLKQLGNALCWRTCVNVLISPLVLYRGLH